MAELSSAKRKKIPGSQFIFPKTKSYPIPDKKHGKYALEAANGARSGKPASPAKKAKIRSAVFAKFPSLKNGISKLGEKR